jgi:hypothetical protein
MIRSQRVRETLLLTIACLVMAALATVLQHDDHPAW